MAAFAGCEVDEWGNDTQNPAHSFALRSVSQSAPRVGLPPTGVAVPMHFVNAWVQDTSFPQTMDKVEDFVIDICRSPTGCNPPQLGSAMTCRDLSSDAVLCQFSLRGERRDYTLYANQIATVQYGSGSSNPGIFRSGVWYYDAGSEARARNLFDRLYRAYSEARNQNFETAVRDQQRQIDQTTAALTTVAAAGTAVSTGQSGGAASAPSAPRTGSLGEGWPMYGHPVVNSADCIRINDGHPTIDGANGLFFVNTCNYKVNVLYCDRKSPSCTDGRGLISQYRAGEFQALGPLQERQLVAGSHISAGFDAVRYTALRCANNIAGYPCFSL